MSTRTYVLVIQPSLSLAFVSLLPLLPDLYTVITQKYEDFSVEAQQTSRQPCHVTLTTLSTFPDME